MKKWLSIFLALVMTMGIGVSGMVSAHAELNLDDLNLEQIVMSATPLAYLLVKEEKFRDDFEAGLLPGKSLEEVDALLTAATADIIAGDETTITQEQIEKALADCNQIIADNFTTDFVAELNAFLRAYLQAAELYLVSIDKIMTILDSLDNSSSIISSFSKLLKFQEVAETLDKFTIEKIINAGDTVAELTTYCNQFVEELTAEMIILDRRLAQKWWQALPSWLQFILKWVFFGWIWMAE